MMQPFIPWFTKKKGLFLGVVVIAAMLISSVAKARETAAFEYLQGVMDQYHTTFNVYMDLSDAGNHFVTLGPGAVIALHPEA